MKVVVPVTINDTNMMSDAVDETYPEWGTTKRLVEYQMPDTTIVNTWHVWENPENGDVYMGSGRNVYKQAGGTGAFVSFANVVSNYSIMDMSGNPNAGYLYCLIKLSNLYYIVAINLETGVAGPNTASESSGLGVIRSITADLTDGRVYYAAAVGIRYTDATLADAPADHDATRTDVYSLRIHRQSDTMYALTQGAGGNVYKYPSMATTASIHAAFAYGSVLCVTDPGDIYVMTSGSDIYVDAGATGTFSEVPEYAAGTATGLSESHRIDGIYIHGLSKVYLASESLFFNEGEYCISGTRVYVSLVENNTAETSDSTKWFRYSAVNHLNMFDGASSTPTTGVGELNLTIDNSNMTAMGFFGVVAESITVTLTVDAAEVFSETKALRNTEISDWYDYFFEPINQIRIVVFTDIPAYTTGVFSVTISGSGETDPVECVLCVAGFSYDIGRTKRNVRPRIVSYSTQTIDSFGRVTFVRRNSAKRIEGDAFVEDRSDFERVFSLMDQIRDTPCMWIVSRDFDAWSILYGLHQKFEPVVANNNGTYSFELLEVLG